MIQFLRRFFRQSYIELTLLQISERLASLELRIINAENSKLFAGLQAPKEELREVKKKRKYVSNKKLADRIFDEIRKKRHLSRTAINKYCGHKNQTQINKALRFLLDSNLIGEEKVNNKNGKPVSYYAVLDVNYRQKINAE
jgi:chromosome segregation and condensation protein ScpB